MLLKYKKIAGEYRFIRTLRNPDLISFIAAKCNRCKYYIKNRNDNKTLCVRSGYEKINRICSQDDFSRLRNYMYILNDSQKM